MQNIEDGEYKPGIQLYQTKKEFFCLNNLLYFCLETKLETNFTIPKRKSEEIANDSNTSQASPYEYQTVLANSYYNYNSNALMGQWPQANCYYAGYPTTYDSSLNVSEPITQQIYSTLENYKEKPKNLKKDICKSTRNKYNSVTSIIKDMH